MHIAQACLKNVTTYHFWCLADHYSYLVSCIHVQIRLMSTNFSLNGGVPWHAGTNGSFFSICKHGIEDVGRFVLACHFFKGRLTNRFCYGKLFLHVWGEGGGGGGRGFTQECSPTFSYIAFSKQINCRKNSETLSARKNIIGNITLIHKSRLN